MEKEIYVMKFEEPKIEIFTLGNDIVTESYTEIDPTLPEDPFNI